MILILCKSRPEGESVITLEEKARSAFPHPRNTAYFDAIAKRKDYVSRANSFFALCLLSVLCDRLGEDRSRLSLSKSEDGRPFFEDSHLDFSISHSGGYVAVALSDTTSVGIDLELSKLSPEKAIALAKRYFSDCEAEKVNSGQIDGECLGESEVFKRIWTQKEAYAKMSAIPLSKILDSRGSIPNIAKCLVIDGIPLTLCAEEDGETVII